MIGRINRTKSKWSNRTMECNQNQLKIYIFFPTLIDFDRLIVRSISLIHGVLQVFRSPHLGPKTPIWSSPPPTLFPGFPPFEEYFCDQPIYNILHNSLTKITIPCSEHTNAWNIPYKGTNFHGNLFSPFSWFFDQIAKIWAYKIQFLPAFYRKIWKIPRKMKLICPKKVKTGDSREMRIFQFFFRPQKLVPAKISFGEH